MKNKSLYNFGSMTHPLLSVLAVLFFAVNVMAAGTTITMGSDSQCCGCCCTQTGNMDMASHGLPQNNADAGCSDQDTPQCHVKACDVTHHPLSEISLTSVSFKDPGSQTVKTVDGVLVSNPGHVFRFGTQTDHQRPSEPIYINTCTFLC